MAIIPDSASDGKQFGIAGDNREAFLMRQPNEEREDYRGFSQAFLFLFFVSGFI